MPKAFQGNSAQTWDLNSSTIPQSFSGLPDEGLRREIGVPGFSASSFQSMPKRTGFWIVVPHWFLVSIAGMLAATPWLTWSRRFSLRTLLIATTLIALALGLIVSANRWKNLISGTIANEPNKVNVYVWTNKDPVERAAT